MSPMLSPIRAGTSNEFDDAGSPEHGGVAALVDASSDENIGAISSGDTIVRRPAQTMMSAAVTLNWPSPNGRIARTISEQIDSSPVAQEFEDEMLCQDISSSPCALVQHSSSSAAVSAGSDTDRKQVTEAAAALRIQASIRGMQGRMHAQQRRAAARHAANAQPTHEHPRVVCSTRRQLQFDAPTAADAEELEPVAKARAPTATTPYIRRPYLKCCHPLPPGH